MSDLRAILIGPHGWKHTRARFWASLVDDGNSVRRPTLSEMRDWRRVFIESWRETRAETTGELVVLTGWNPATYERPNL